VVDNEHTPVGANLNGEVDSAFSINNTANTRAGLAEPESNLMFDAPEPGVVPDLKEDVGILLALEGRLQDLAYLEADIVKSQGMNRSFAMEAERLVPGFGGVPLGYYTEQTTATRYRLSLEQISKGAWALIAAAVAAVIAGIVKLVSWLSGGSKDGEKGSAEKMKTNAQKREEEFKKFEEELFEAVSQPGGVFKDIHDGKVTAKKSSDGKQWLDEELAGLKGEDEKAKATETAKTVTITIDSLMTDLFTDEARHSAALRLLKEPPAEIYDIVHPGKWSINTISAGKMLPMIESLLVQKTHLLYKIANTDVNNFETLSKGQSLAELEMLSKPIVVKVDGKDMTTEEMGDRLSGFRAQNRAEVEGKELLLKDMLAASVDDKNVGDVVKISGNVLSLGLKMLELDTILTKLEKKVADLSKDGTKDHNTEGVAPMIRQAIFKIGADINGIKRLFAEIETHNSAQRHLWKQTLGMAKEVERILMSLAKKGSAEMPAGWNKT
jgi:hypothetical protein